MHKILLVEDNEMNRDMLSRRLERRGYEVSIAVDGMEALQHVKRNRPDLILMDMNLPVLDGWEVTSKIKSDPLVRETPVLALTAHVMPGDRQKAIEVGCDDFDVKPIEFSRLLEKIRKLLGQK